MAADQKNLTFWSKRRSSGPDYHRADGHRRPRAVAKHRRRTEEKMCDCDSGSAGAGGTATQTFVIDPSDLLVRLRDAAFDADDMLIANVKALFREAADDIERLRRLTGTRPGDRTGACCRGRT
jgi:hypothetical protein